MSVAYSQSSSTQPTAAGTATQVRLANTASNALVAAGTWGIGSAANVAIADTTGNSWVTAYTASDAVNSQTVAVWYALNVGTASVNTVTMTTPSINFRGLALHEYSGVATATASDGTNVVNATVTSLSAGTVTTTQTGDLLFGYAVNTGGGNVLTATNSATTRERTIAGQIFASADSVQGAAGAGNMTWTMSAAQASVTGMLALKAAAVGAVSDDVLIRYGSMDATSGSGLVTAAFASTAPASVAGGGLLPWYYEEIVQDGI